MNFIDQPIDIIVLSLNMIESPTHWVFLSFNSIDDSADLVAVPGGIIKVTLEVIGITISLIVTSIECIISSIGYITSARDNKVTWAIHLIRLICCHNCDEKEGWDQEDYFIFHIEYQYI